MPSEDWLSSRRRSFLRESDSYLCKHNTRFGRNRGKFRTFRLNMGSNPVFPVYQFWEQTSPPLLWWVPTEPTTLVFFECYCNNPKCQTEKISDTMESSWIWTMELGLTDLSHKSQKSSIKASYFWFYSVTVPFF